MKWFGILSLLLTLALIENGYAKGGDAPTVPGAFKGLHSDLKTEVIRNLHHLDILERRRQARPFKEFSESPDFLKTYILEKPVRAVYRIIFDAILARDFALANAILEIHSEEKRSELLFSLNEPVITFLPMITGMPHQVFVAADSPVTLAFKNKDHALFRFLKKWGIKFDTHIPQQRGHQRGDLPVLYVAVEEDDLHSVKILLKDQPEVDENHALGLLKSAFKSQSHHMFRYLLEQGVFGVNSNAGLADSIFNYIGRAVKENDPYQEGELIETLKALTEKTELRLTNGPMIRAIQTGSLKLVRFVIQYQKIQSPENYAFVALEYLQEFFSFHEADDYHSFLGNCSHVSRGLNKIIKFLRTPNQPSTDDSVDEALIQFLRKAEIGDYEAVGKILEEPLRPDLKERIFQYKYRRLDGSYPLPLVLRAVIRNDLQLLKILVSHGLPVNQEVEYLIDGSSKIYIAPLAFAAYLGRAEVVEFLLQKLGKPGSNDEHLERIAALNYAIFFSQLHIFELLLESGVDLSSSYRTASPLYLAMGRATKLNLQEETQEERRIFQMIRMLHKKSGFKDLVDFSGRKISEDDLDKLVKDTKNPRLIQLIKKLESN